MIQATELRLNNYVKYNGIVMSVTAIDSPKPRKEKRFDGKYIIELFDGTGFTTATNDQIEGIDLTEELLLGSGFEFFKVNKSYQIDFNLGFTIWGRQNGLNIFCNSDELGETIKYLHHLQNTVNAITQKELQINLHNQK